MSERIVHHQPGDLLALKGVPDPMSFCCLCLGPLVFTEDQVGVRCATPNPASDEIRPAHRKCAPKGYRP